MTATKIEPKSSASNETAAIAKLETELDELSDRRWGLQQITRGPEAAQKVLDAAKQEKIELIAQAMATGTAPNTALADQKIADAAAALTAANEQAEAARAAIILLEDRQKEISAEIARLERIMRKKAQAHFADDLAEAKKQLAQASADSVEAQSREGQIRNQAMRLVIDNLLVKVEEPLRICIEDHLPLLIERIASLQQQPAEAGLRIDRADSISRDTAMTIGLRSIPTPAGALDDILRRMELLLSTAAPHAEVLELVFGEEQVKRALIGFLLQLTSTVQSAVRTCRIAVPDWAYGGRAYSTWTKPEHLEPVQAFLTESGVTW